MKPFATNRTVAISFLKQRARRGHPRIRLDRWCSLQVGRLDEAGQTRREGSSSGLSSQSSRAHVISSAHDAVSTFRRKLEPFRLVVWTTVEELLAPGICRPSGDIPFGEEFVEHRRTELIGMIQAPMLNRG